MPGINYYLGIGIDKYPGSKELNNAVGDVKRIAAILEEKYVFTAISPPLFDQEATRENILNALYYLNTAIGPDDNLIIYYAGHGNKAATSNAGYWEPIDFDLNRLVSTQVPNSSVIDLIEGIGAKHILLISDSCFSGTFLEHNRAGKNITDHEYLEGLRSGWILVSGGLDTVGDGVKGKGSPFSKTLCRVLQNNNRPSMAACEFFEEVIRQMSVSSFQKPEAAPMRRVNEGGEMIFRLRNDIPKPIPHFAIPAVVIQHEYLSRTLTAYSEGRPALSFFFEPEVGNVVIDDLITTQKRIVILGGAGSGKSMEISKAMERVLGSEKGLIPVYRRLNNYTEGDLDQYLPAKWNEVPIDRLLIFLDGLDEIQPQFVNTALRKIGDFSDRHPESTIVVSCRTNFYELPSKSFSGTLSGFRVYLLNDIGLPAILNFVSETGLDGDRFIKEVQKGGYLDLVQKPYFLSILFSFFQEHQHLNVRRSDVLNNALERYFEANREQYKTTETPLPYKELVPFAERIAFVMELMGKNFITDEEISKVITKSEEYRSLRYLPAFRYDQEKEQWHFEHNNIQEYLASRVLKRQGFDRMVDVLTLSGAGISKIKPTWVNTLSFMISIGDDDEIKDILEWLIKNEPEILVRFEPDRLPLSTRIALFKQIFSHYQSLQIWLSSNKFSDLEFARFGQSEEVVDYILTVIEDQGSTRIDILNALHVLRKFEIEKFGSYLDRIKTGILSMLERKDLNESNQYSIIGSLTDLGITDEETIQYIVQKFGNRENQYLRAGLYKIISKSGQVDDYVDIYLTGLNMTRFNYKSKDRGTVMLMDEESQLKAGIVKIRSPHAIRKLLELVSADINTVHQFFVQFKDEIFEILSNIFAAYRQDTSLFSLVAAFFARHATESRSVFLSYFTGLIDENEIRWEIIQFVLNGKGLREYEISSAAAALINEETFSLVIEKFKKGTIGKDLLYSIFNTFKWRQILSPQYASQLPFFTKMLIEHTGMEIEADPAIDREASFKIKAQKNFDIIFDTDLLKAELIAAFQYLDKEIVDHDDLHAYKNGEYVDIGERFSTTTAELLRSFTYGNGSISQKFLLEWIDNSGQFENFKIQIIRARLSNLPELTVSKNQLDYITDWVLRTDVANAYTWYFIKRFALVLPEQRYLAFTRFYSPAEERELQQSGFIELLQQFLSKEKIANEVRTNIKRNDIDPNAWDSNAAYALRNDLSDTFQTIIEHITHTDQSESRTEDLLKFWFGKTQDIQRLIQVVEDDHNEYLRREALRLLMDCDKGHEFLIAYYLKEISKQETNEDDKITAANRLIILGALDGFEYLAGLFLNDPSPDFDFRNHFREITQLTTPDAIGSLMKMLTYAKQPDYKRDVFDDLEPMILETLFNIGIQSHEHFEAVNKALNTFISEHRASIEHVNFLQFTITKIEEQLNRKLSREFKIEDAIDLFHQLN